MITIIDYGLGNIKAFVNVYDRLNIITKVARNPSDLKNSKKIILPGVGAFDYAMTQLNNSGMRTALEHEVLHNNIPILGVCVGMQMLGKSSEEGTISGLGWIDGTVKKFEIDALPHNAPLPHMGWNTVMKDSDSPLLKDFKNHSRFYFLHSYYFECDNSENSISKTEYGITFTSAVNEANI